MLQGSEASLRAEVAMLRDEQASGGPRLGPMPDSPLTDVAEAAAAPKKGLKGWGDRVKEMKELAEKTKAVTKSLKK